MASLHNDDTEDDDLKLELELNPPDKFKHLSSYGVIPRQRRPADTLYWIDYDPDKRYLKLNGFVIQTFQYESNADTCFTKLFKEKGWVKKVTVKKPARAGVIVNIVLPDPELKKLKVKLISTFNDKHYQTQGEIQRLEAVNLSLKQNIANKVDAVTDPKNEIIVDEIRASIEKLKAEYSTNEEKIALLSDQHDSDLGEFLDFAFTFLGNKGRRFFELSGEDMKRCKQLVFTGKIYVDTDKNIYTHDISSIFRGKELEKDTEVSLKSNVVRSYRTCLNFLNGS